jgi:predicted nucleic acid-binding protein
MQHSIPIVDASVAVALFVEGERTATADRLFSAGSTLLAPDILIAEVANALWLYRRAAKRRDDSIGDFLDGLSNRIELVPSHSLAKDAFTIACDLDHPVYDAFYLALARAEKTHVVTFDDRLLRKLAGTRYASLAVAADRA